jgi:hypothetical protein
MSEVGEPIMGRSSDEFVKYPRTSHLFGSRGTGDDKHLGEAESLRFLADESLIAEEKLDGSNVGIHFGPEALRPGRLGMRSGCEGRDRGPTVTDFRGRPDARTRWARSTSGWTNA